MVFKLIKFYMDKLFSSKYVLEGECKQCGDCCRNIVFYAYNEPIKEIETFNQFKKNNKYLNNFHQTGVNKQGELLFTCKSLGENNLCKNYLFRSLYCRKYPLVKSLLNGRYLQTSERCGYKISVKKEFTDFLNNE